VGTGLSPREGWRNDEEGPAHRAHRDPDPARGGSSAVRDIAFGYGGLELEYINRPGKLLHFTLYGLVGAGGVTLPTVLSEGDAVFVAEPKANLILNVAPVMRIGVGAGYRWVTGTNSIYYDSSDLSAGTIDLTLFFGKF
jgi:hypothetical protein